MSDEHGEVFSKVPFEQFGRVTFWHMNDNMVALKGHLDPRIRVIESHQETIGDEVVTVIDRFEIVEVSLVSEASKP